MRVVLFVLLVAACDRKAAAVPEAPAPVEPATPPGVLPELEVTTIDGERFTSDALRGKVALVMYWASWCEPCVTEGPGIEGVYRKHRHDGFAMLGLSRDQADDATLRRFRDKYDFTYPIARTSEALDARLHAPAQIPAFVLYGRDGRVRWKMTGALPAEILDREISAALAVDQPVGARLVTVVVVRSLDDAPRLATLLARERAAGPVLAVLVGEAKAPPAVLNALRFDVLVAGSRPEGVAVPRLSQYQVLRAGGAALALIEPGNAAAAREDGGAELVLGLAAGPGVDVVLGEPGLAAYAVDVDAKRATPRALSLDGLAPDRVILRLAGPPP